MRVFGSLGPFGGVHYQEPLKRVWPGCVRTPSVWAWIHKPRWH